jgi:hypothetical protein
VPDSPTPKRLGKDRRTANISDMLLSGRVALRVVLTARLHSACNLAAQPLASVGSLQCSSPAPEVRLNIYRSPTVRAVSSQAVVGEETRQADVVEESTSTAEAAPPAKPAENIPTEAPPILSSVGLLFLLRLAFCDAIPLGDAPVSTSNCFLRHRRVSS